MRTWAHVNAVRRREGVVDGAVVFALKVGLGVWLVSRGLSHISDDDFARAVIAEQFAHAPRLDPSGTSWLPFPFWITGSAMMAFGRSLAIARGAALVLGGVGAVLVHAALRRVGVGRVAAMAGVVLAMATPWNAWLGASAVPEGFTGAFVAAATILAGAMGTGARGIAARRGCWVAVSVVLGCAALSRYEAWPACLVVALARIVGVVRAGRASSTRVPMTELGLALLPMGGPAAWMAWNLYAHGSATHFVARVTAYRHAIGAAGAPLAEKLAVYPRALLEAPEVLLVSLAGFAAFAWIPRMRARWGLPLAAALAVLAFLIYGETQEGAPTHHPARALVSIWWTLAVFGVDGVRELVGRMRIATARPSIVVQALAVVSIAGAALAWAGSRSDAWSLFPTHDSKSESRRVQIERGLALRKAGAAHLVVTPCAYEHFALIAAYGAPESVEIRPASHEPVHEGCPRVDGAR